MYCTLNCSQQLPPSNSVFTNWGECNTVMYLITFILIMCQNKNITDITILGWAVAETVDLLIHVWWILYHYEIRVKSRTNSCNVMDSINIDLDELPLNMDVPAVTICWLLVWKYPHINDTVWVYRFYWLASVFLHIFLLS